MAMKVTSTTTLVTGSQLEPVHHKPGTPVDLPKAEAEDLIERGLAVPFSDQPTAPLPEFSQQEREHPGTGVPMEEVDGDTLPKPAPKKKARNKKTS
jgi:hypothetical protein